MSETEQVLPHASAPARGDAAPRRRRWAAEDSLTRHADFNKLWFGQSVSVLGSDISTIALPLTAILMLGATAGQIGLLNAFNTAATLVLMLFAGVLVDRVRRRRVMIVADLGRAIAIGVVPLAALTGHLSMGLLYGTVLVVGALTVIFELASLAHLPTLVPRDRLVSANSRLQGTEAAGGIIGANLGGTLVTVLRPATALVVDAVSFLVSAASLALIRKPDPKPEVQACGEARSRVRAMLHEIGEGIGPNYRNPYLRPLTFNSASTNFLSQIILTLFILYAARDLQLSPVWIGVIYGAGSVGGVAGALVTSWMSRRFGFGRALLTAMIAFRFLALAPLISGPEELMIPLLCAVWFTTVVGVVMSNVSAATLRQVIVPQEMQGRVMAAHRLLGYGTLPIAALVAGGLGETLGVRTTMIVAAALLPLTLVWVLRSPLPGLRRPEDAPYMS